MMIFALKEEGSDRYGSGYVRYGPFIKKALYDMGPLRRFRMMKAFYKDGFVRFWPSKKKVLHNIGPLREGLVLDGPFKEHIFLTQESMARPLRFSPHLVKRVGIPSLEVMQCDGVGWWGRRL